MERSRPRADATRTAETCIIRWGPGFPACGRPAARSIEVEVYDDLAESGFARQAVPVCREHHAVLFAAVPDEDSKSG